MSQGIQVAFKAGKSEEMYSAPTLPGMDIPLLTACSKSHSKTGVRFLTCLWNYKTNLCCLKVIWQRRQWHPTPVLLPGKPHGWRSLVGSVHGVPKSRTQLSDFPFTFHFYALEKEMATHSSVLAWRIPGQGSLVGCRLWGRRVGHYWSDLAAAAR